MTFISAIRNLSYTNRSLNNTSVAFKGNEAVESIIPEDEMSKLKQLSRQELINKIVWYDTESWDLGPDSYEKVNYDLKQPKSVVFIGGPDSNYTDKELVKLAWLSEKVTEKYDKFFGTGERRGANYLYINKESDDRWYRAKSTWQYGPMWSDNLDEVVEKFHKGL